MTEIHEKITDFRDFSCISVILTVLATLASDSPNIGEVQHRKWPLGGHFLSSNDTLYDRTRQAFGLAGLKLQKLLFFTNGVPGMTHF